jgi:hypothetical protein
MEPGETFIEYDVGHSRRAPFPKMNVLASTHAVYTEYPGQRAVRYPYPVIKYFSGNGSEFELKTLGGRTDVAFGVKGQSRGVDRIIRDRLIAMPELVADFSTSSGPVSIFYYPCGPTVFPASACAAGSAGRTPGPTLSRYGRRRLPSALAARLQRTSRPGFFRLRPRSGMQ